MKLPLRSSVLSLACLTLLWPGAAAAQREASGHVVLSRRDRGGIGAFAVTRDRAERLYVGIAGVGTAVYTRGGSRPELLTDRGPLVVGEFSWVGDTLAVQGWRSWTRFDAALRAVGCVPFVDAHNEFVTQVFPDLLLGGGLTVGELLPPYPDSRLTEALVVSRNQSVLRTLFQRRSGSGKRFQVPMDSGSGYWEVPEPFGMVSPWDVADDGSAAVFVSVDRPRHVGFAPAKITWVSIAGDTVARTVVQLPVVRVTRPAMAAEADQFAEGELDQSLGVDTSGLRGRFLDHVRFPKLHPPLTAAVIEADRAVWVRLSTNTDSVEWRRIDRNGAVTHRAVTAAAFVGLYADRDGLWGRLSDSGRWDLMLYGTAPPPYGPLDPPDDRPAGAVTIGGCAARDQEPVARVPTQP